MECRQRTRQRFRIGLPSLGRQRRQALADPECDEAKAGCQGLGRVGGKCAVAGEGREIERVGGELEEARDGAVRVRLGLGIELGQALGRAALAGWRAEVEQDPAADGALRRGVAQDETVARRRRDRLFENQLGIALAARRDALGREGDQPRRDVGGAMMQPDRQPGRGCLGFARQHAQAYVDPVGRRMEGGVERHVAA